jgi:enediyne core biosynthesis thioesterase
MPEPGIGKLEFFEYRHVCTFEDSNVVGNIYFANYVKWQGRCRELFLLQEAPEILDQLFPKGDLALVTTRCSCQFMRELLPLQTVCIRMRLKSLEWNRVGMQFEYIDEAGVTVAEGDQEIACMKREVDGSLSLIPELPEPLRMALSRYRC